MKISVENAEHYVWGGNSDGWHLLKHDDVSVIQERVPAGGAEVMHYHNTARQIFYVLEGEATMAFENREIHLKRGMGSRSSRR